MFILIGENHTQYLQIVFNYLNLNYINLKTFKDLQDFDYNDEKYVFILKNKTGFHKDFIKDLCKLLSIKDNLIIGYSANVKNISNSNQTIIELNNNFRTSRWIDNNDISIFGFKISVYDLKNSVNTILKNNLEYNDKHICKNLNSKISYFDYLVSNINFQYISNKSYLSHYTVINKKYNIFKNNYEILFGEISKDDILENINNNYLNYTKYLVSLNNNITPRYLLSNIINNLFHTNISVYLIFNNDLLEILKIVKSFCKNNKHNLFFNRMIILVDNIDISSIISNENNENNENTKNTNNKITLILDYLNNELKKEDLTFNAKIFIFETDNLPVITNKILSSVRYFNDIYFITNHNELLITDNNYKYSKYIHLHYQDDKLFLVKIKKGIIDCFTILNIFNSIVIKNDYSGIIKFKNVLAYLVKNIFIDDYIIYNVNYVEEDIVNDEIINNYKKQLQLNDELLNYYYDEKDYDFIYYCLKYTYINKLCFSSDIVFKNIAISQYTNIIVSIDDICSMISLISEITITEVINILIILENHKEEFSVCYIKLYDKFVLSNEINTDNIFLILYLWYNSNIFDKSINIVDDKEYINIILQYIDHIYQNYELIKQFNKNLDADCFIEAIIIFVVSRFNLIDKKEDIIKINNIMREYSKFDHSNLENESPESIINQFLKNPGLMIINITALSDCMISNKDIELKRYNANKFYKTLRTFFEKEENLKELKEIINNGKIDFNLMIKINSNFKYSYHGKTNKELFENTVFIVKKILNILIFNKLPYLKDKEPYYTNLYNYNFKNTNKKKICFISNFLTQKHSVFKDRHQVIKHLANNGFDVYVATYRPLNYMFSKKFQGIKENIVLNQGYISNIIENIEKIRSYNFDKVVFCEIGMDGSAALLALFKLGKKQYNTWGHSDTSGYDSIDYYVSSKLYELPYEESQKHYSEKLILQNSLCTSYVNPIEDYIFKNKRTFYGLSQYDKIILCPQSLFKIHPEYDEYIFEILYQNPDVNLIFVDALDKKHRMYERWDNKITEKYKKCLSRVKFVGSLTHYDFVNLIKLSNILIDPYPFGGCNTSFESFACGIPLVTRPSNMINGRFTYGFYKFMEFEDCIAYSKEQYIDIVTKLLNDNKFYKHCQNEILKKKDRLFMDKETLKEWEDLMSK